MNACIKIWETLHCLFTTNFHSQAVSIEVYYEKKYIHQSKAKTEVSYLVAHVFRKKGFVWGISHVIPFYST